MNASISNSFALQQVIHYIKESNVEQDAVKAAKESNFETMAFIIRSSILNVTGEYTKSLGMGFVLDVIDYIKATRG